METLEFEILGNTSTWRVSTAPQIAESEIQNKSGQETDMRITALTTAVEKPEERRRRRAITQALRSA